MKKFWTAVFYRALQAIIDVDWGMIQARVRLLWNSPAKGREKHQLIFDELRSAGSEIAPWMLDIAIKAAYGKVLSGMEKQQ
jgi:hypothetical protein